MSGDVDALVSDRDAARRERDYARADAIKAQIDALGDAQWRVALLDEPGGTFWYWTMRRPAIAASAPARTPSE